MRLLGEALRDLRANRVRSLLAGVSLFVAVLAVVAIYVGGSVVRDVFVATEEQKDGRAATIEALVPLGTLSGQRVASITTVLHRRVEAQGGAYALVGQAIGAIRSAAPASTTQSADITLVAGRLDHVRRLPILRGRWLAPEGQLYPAELVVNQGGASQYGPVGSMVSVQPVLSQPAYRARIVGEIADGTSSPNVYASLATAVSFRPGVLGTSAPDLFLHAPRASEDDLMALTRRVAADLGADPAQVEPHRYDQVPQLLHNLRLMQGAFFGAAVIALLIAVIGLLNIGLASVRERAHELVIRRAVGATRARVFGLVLLSSVLIALVAGTAAVLAALAAVVWLVPHLLDPARALNDPTFPWGAALAGLGVAAAAGVLGGSAPAINAARVDVAYALRD